METMKEKKLYWRSSRFKNKSYIPLIASFWIYEIQKRGL